MGRVGRGLPLRLATRVVSAPTERACRAGRLGRCGMERAFSLHSVACSPELGVHRPSLLWENNPLTSQGWMELRDRLSDDCVSCWASNCRGAGPAPTAATATTRQAGLTALGAPLESPSRGLLGSGPVFRPGRTRPLHQDQSSPLKARVATLVVPSCLQWPDVVPGSLPPCFRRPFSVSFREVSYPALWSSPLRALLAKRYRVEGGLTFSQSQNHRTDYCLLSKCEGPTENNQKVC